MEGLFLQSSPPKNVSEDFLEFLGDVMCARFLSPQCVSPEIANRSTGKDTILRFAFEWITVFRFSCGVENFSTFKLTQLIIRVKQKKDSRGS